MYNENKKIVVDTIRALDKESLDFICRVWNRDRDYVLSADSDNDFTGLYYCLDDIKTEETGKAAGSDCDISEKGKLAEKLLTVIGNAYAKKTEEYEFRCPENPDLKYLVDDIQVPEDETELFRRRIRERYERIASDPVYKYWVVGYVRAYERNGCGKNFGPDRPFLCPQEARNYFEIKEISAKAPGEPRIHPMYRNMKFKFNGEEMPAEEYFKKINGNKASGREAENRTGAPNPGGNSEE